MRYLTTLSQHLHRSQLSAFSILAASAALGINAATIDAPCEALVAANLSNRLLFPIDDAYEPAIDSYWAVNVRQRPWCIYQPENTEEVSRGIQALATAGYGAGDWHIALRSGGHSANGNNNIENGVTIDLTMMNQSTYGSSTELASIQPGARWNNVYANLLDKYNVTATGGRDGGVGVGGFLLGGGNSFYAGTTGFGCDSVVNYEVVLANGTILNANASHHSDLWRALKGGSLNFGIVTRYDMTTKPAQDVFYGLKFMSSNYTNDFIDAVVRFTDDSHLKPESALVPTLSHDRSAPNITSSLIAIYVNTVGNANSSVLDDIKRIPAITTDETIQSMAAAAEGSRIPSGTWNTLQTLTFANDPTILHYAAQIHEQLVTNLSALIGPEQFDTQWFFQPIPSYFAKIGKERGGNMLSFPDNQNTILWTGGVLVDTDERDYVVARTLLREASANIKRFSEEVGGNIDMIFLNYADANQDPLGSYGKENVRFMKEVAERYDPDGFFQERVPGGFKIQGWQAKSV